MSNVVPFCRIKRELCKQESRAAPDYQKAMIGFERVSEQLRDHLVTVTAYLEELQAHLEAQSRQP